SAQRNAASVLPDPVGAVMSVCSPVAIAGHACAWTSVGPSKADANQSRTAGVNCDNGTGAQASRDCGQGATAIDGERPASARGNRRGVQQPQRVVADEGGAEGLARDQQARPEGVRGARSDEHEVAPLAFAQDRDDRAVAG